jgi:hypothetical protein
MQAIPAIGATCLGIVIGWLVRFFLFRMKTFVVKGLGSIVSVLVGGTAIRFLATDKTVWWFYPIGLLVGFVVYSVVGAVAVRNDGNGPDYGDDSGGSSQKPTGTGKYDGILFGRKPYE